MYLFIPFINEGIKNLNRKTYRNIVLFLIGFFSFYNIIATIFSKKDYNFLINGYSSLWLIILYIIGGYFGKYLFQSKNYFNKNKFIYFLIYIISSFFTSEIKFKLLQMKSNYSELFVSYISPTILLEAISLVIFASRLNIKNKILIKLISFFIPLTFGILPIHWFFFNKINIMKSIYRWLNTIKNNLVFFKLYGLSILFYFIFAFIDYFRFQLFKIIKIKELILFIKKIKIFNYQ